REAVLVIQARPFDPDRDVAVHQVFFVEVAQSDRLLAILANDDRAERGHANPSCVPARAARSTPREFVDYWRAPCTSARAEWGRCLKKRAERVSGRAWFLFLPRAGGVSQYPQSRPSRSWRS